MEETIVFDPDDRQPDSVPDGDGDAKPHRIYREHAIPDRYLGSQRDHRSDCRLWYSFPDAERYCTCKRNAKRDRGTQPEPERNLRAFRESQPDADSDANWDFEPYA